MEVNNLVLWFSILIYMRYEEIMEQDIIKKIIESNKKINEIIKKSCKTENKKILDIYSIAFTLSLYFSSLKI